jgi:uncharacterized protein
MSSHKRNAVFQAVLLGDLTALKQAIEDGNDINELDRDGRTPLFQAIINGDNTTTTELIKHGADVNAHDKNLETPLHFAARDYKIDLAEILLSHGANVDAQDTHGNTALSRAVFASEGRGEMIRRLLKHSANKTLKNKHGVSPEDLAKSMGNSDVLAFLPQDEVVWVTGTGEGSSK